tara:strand:+ start:262 stop:525 length:264 start_codon:yes stop_codon:yes gene_type:complete
LSDIKIKRPKRYQLFEPCRRARYGTLFAARIFKPIVGMWIATAAVYAGRKALTQPRIRCQRDCDVANIIIIALVNAWPGVYLQLFET